MTRRGSQICSEQILEPFYVDSTNESDNTDGTTYQQR